MSYEWIVDYSFIGSHLGGFVLGALATALGYVIAWWWFR